MGTPRPLSSCDLAKCSVGTHRLFVGGLIGHFTGISRSLSSCYMVECLLFVGDLTKCFMGTPRPLSLHGMVECFVGTP